jgi:hypothetical protein
VVLLYYSRVLQCRTVGDDVLYSTVSYSTVHHVRKYHDVRKYRLHLNPQHRFRSPTCREAASSWARAVERSSEAGSAHPLTLDYDYDYVHCTVHAFRIQNRMNDSTVL